jgi:UDP-glucose 4-epimerase
VGSSPPGRLALRTGAPAGGRLNVLVTGGAGYIGSHTVRELQRHGHRITVLDNFATGHRGAILDELVEADAGDSATVARVCRERRIEGVVHFAGDAAVGESVENPGKYFRNNVAGTIGLLDGLILAGVPYLVLSSTCAVYGTPERGVVRESAPKRPQSPYGESKLMCEQMLPWYERAHGLRSVALRYFNAAGAALDGALGDDVRPAIRIVPVAVEAALGRRPAFVLYGDDYPTRDGTCVRDYVHVEDLAGAHALALRYLAGGGAAGAFNLGGGRGYSNREVIETARRVTGVDFPVVVEPRRPGDPARVCADTTRVREVFGWKPQHDLETMVRTTWEWRRRHPEGYAD